ncbi:MAG: lipopolysaccharide kinase InaA family protein [Planctomycetota bacterium]
MPETGLHFTDPAWRTTLAALGLRDIDDFFTHDAVVAWRSIRERENCVLETALGKLHVKRMYKPGGAADAIAEVAGIEHLTRLGIPTTPLIAHASDEAGRGLIVTEDLAGFVQLDQLLADGRAQWEQLAAPTARLAAKLHTRLHHRDLYLCHFLGRFDADGLLELRLIDPARVKPLPNWFAKRWIVKDLAQFRYGSVEAGVSPGALDAWLRHYGRPDLRAAVVRKFNRIARHDASLQRKQPERRVSIHD